MRRGTGAISGGVTAGLDDRQPTPRAGGHKPVLICPHLDDAVLSCGRYLAATPGVTVITIFAGGPPKSAEITKWDSECGFRPGDDVMAMRRQEDFKALARLDATPVHLEGLDAQYRDGAPDVEGLVAKVATNLKALEPSEVLAPLGLLHEDHRWTTDIAIEACRAAGNRECVVYADSMHARDPSMIQPRLDRITSGFGSLVATQQPQGSRWVKRRATSCYPSQLKAFGINTRLRGWLLEERYWLLTFTEPNQHLDSPGLQAQ